MLGVTYKPLMLSVFMLNVVMLSVVILNVCMLNVFMLNVFMVNIFMLKVVMLTVRMLSVVAPVLYPKVMLLCFRSHGLSTRQTRVKGFIQSGLSDVLMLERETILKNSWQVEYIRQTAFGFGIGWKKNKILVYDS